MKQNGWLGRRCICLRGTQKKSDSQNENSWFQYHPTGGPMQILHFDWLCYQGTVSNSYRVAEFFGFSFVFSPNMYFFKLHFLTLSLPFLSDQLGDTKTIRPFTLKGHGSIAHSASPRVLLTCSPFGLYVSKWNTEHLGLVKVKCMCPSGIQSKSDSMNENSWLGSMYMPMWKTDKIRVNKLELRLRSNVYVQAKCRTNPTQQMRLAVEVQCISKGDDIKI